MRCILVDGLSPVVTAWLQALYSRRPGTILDELEDLGGDIEQVLQSSSYIFDELYIVNFSRVHSTKRAETFLNKWAIGYNHESIMDCGNITLFLEDVPLYAAKAIQHHPLYNGIELSTRYIDFTTKSVSHKEAQPLMEVYDEVKNSLMEEANRRFFRMNSSKLGEWLHSKGVGKKYIHDPKILEKAKKAWVFDIARGYLPISVVTNLSINVTIRTLREILCGLHNPTLGNGDIVLKHSNKKKQSLKTLACDIYKLLSEKYPTIDWIGGKYSITVENLNNSIDASNVNKTTIDTRLVQTDNSYTGKRKYLQKIVNGVIDYGSWRDLARHRTAYGLPFVLPAFGSDPHPFYVNSAKREIPKAPMDYTLALLAHLVPVSFLMQEKHYDYFYRLRTNPAVHPTLRYFILQDKTILNNFTPRVSRGKDDVTKES